MQALTHTPRLGKTLAVALLSSTLVLPARAQIVTYTFTQGPSTEFANGSYLTGSMTVDYSLVGSNRVTAANLVLTNPTPFTFGLGNLGYFGSFSNVVCGNTLNFDEAYFSGGGYDLYLDVISTNTTAPVPGTSNVYTSLTAGGNNYALTATCLSYNNPTPPGGGGGLAQAVSDQGRSVGAGAAQVLDANPALGGLITGTSQQQAAAVVQTLPLLTGGAQQAAGTALTGINRVIQSRQDVLRGLSSGGPFLRDHALWIKPFGSWARQSNEGSVAGFKARTGGIVLGGDADVSPNTRLGLAFSWAGASVNSRSVDAPNAASVRIYQLVGYGTHQLGNGSELTFQLDAGRNQTRGQRSLLFAGTTAHSRYSSSSWHAGLAWSRTVEQANGARYTPSVSLDYTRVRDSAYAETGAGVFNLDVAARRAQEIVLGADLRWSQPLSERTHWSAQAGVGYDFGARRSVITASFAGAPGAVFVTEGIRPSPWLLRGGVGLSHKTQQGTELLWRYDLEGRTGFLNQTASVKAVWRF